LGHARDVTARPGKTGDETKLDRSPLVVKTIGIVVVAAFAASIPGLLVTITAT
jgi:hypothetical protein